jgi:ABC-type glycerol-3-phosphate transport system substrate-binding protein
VIETYTRWHEAAATLGVAPVGGIPELNERWGRAEHFRTGHLATTAIYSAGFAQAAQWTELDAAFMPWPKPRVSTPEIYCTGLGLLPPAARREQAWAWVAYLHQDARLAQFLGRPPLEPALLAGWVADLFKAWPRARTQVVAQALELAVSPDPFWDHPRSNDLDQEYIQPALRRIMAGEVTAADELRRIKAPMQALLDRQ